MGACVLLTDCDAWVRVGGLNQLFALVSDHPVGVYLCGSLGIQVDHLELPEVGDADGIVFRTHVKNVWDAVIVKIIFAGIPPSIPCWRKMSLNGSGLV